MDIYAEVTNRIIDQLESGIIPWQKPWIASGSAVSRATGKPYSLLNQMILGRGGEYLTFAQCQKEGGKIRKGEKSQMVVFWKFIEQEDEETHEKKQVPFLRYYNGSIVDIDFWNHIYINPLDGTITPYYAESMMEKYVYKSFENLLSEQCPRLYENYERLRLEEKHSIGVLKRKIDVGADEIIEFVSDTYMYKPSRVLRFLQYIVDASVIRVWNDELIDSMVEKYGLSAPQILG